jgi:ribosomal protein S12 methylthiotransferase
MDEANRLAQKGTKELLVIAQDSTSYGWDLDTKVYLSDLLRELNTVDGIDWIRIHYAHPAHLSQRIIDSIAESEKVCNYLDMPVQHASDAILKSMKRGLNQKGIRDRINRLRESVPEIALRTTLIVGYPGETEDDFKELSDFVEDIRFDRLGVFTYSEEEGTTAADLDDNIPRDIKNERKNQIIELQHGISLERNESLIGKSLKVLVDQAENNIGVGRTEFDSPEIDNIVHINGEVAKGEFVNIDIKAANEYELIGKPVK